jgi:hypothetical protein
MARIAARAGTSRGGACGNRRPTLGAREAAPLEKVPRGRLSRTRRAEHDGGTTVTARGQLGDPRPPGEHRRRGGERSKREAVGEPEQVVALKRGESRKMRAKTAPGRAPGASSLPPAS